jgi:two-component system phosphate regulon sensor histidine kinase PhoR
VLLASLPLLVILLLITSGQGWLRVVLMACAWLAASALAAEVVWRRSAAAASEVMDELAAGTFEEAARGLRELKERATRCDKQRHLMTVLVEDITRSLGEGLVVVDSELRLRLINRVALSFCGTDAVDVGSHLLEILRTPEVVEVIENAAAGGQPEPVVTENPRGLWEVRAFPIRGGGAVVLMSDESLVRQAAEFRRRFVQDLSHELRSPLAVLRTTVEAAAEQVEPQLVEILVRQVERLDRLTRELFELATIESGHLELELGPVEVQTVVREVVRDLAPEAERAGVEVRIEVPEDLRAICDRRGLYRVLSNLVDNAIKYNHRGGSVEIDAAVAAEEATLRVADSGEGIPAGELKAVLQRFYRIDRARTPGSGGLGLGLAIVKHLVQHMGGRLELDSREGVGTTVTLIFAV